ncbi:hypothetical protein D030_3382B, partial [Vibrio parahaemolyticus AQ3810]
AK